MAVPGALLALAAVGWWWSIRMAGDMRGDDAMGAMDMGSMSGGDVVSLGAFIVAWLAMMTAMMFPAIAPVVKLYATCCRCGSSRAVAVLRGGLHRGVDCVGVARLRGVAVVDGPDR